MNKQFGSKKSKRKTEQNERLNMNVSHIEKELQETVAGKIYILYIIFFVKTNALLFLRCEN